MAQDLKASVSFVGDGTTTKFYFGFDYISKQFIKVAVGTDDTILSYPTDYTVNDKEVEFVEAPAKDTPIRIYRQTDSSRIIEWSDGSFIKASQMTLENVQQLHLIEESQDYVIINGMSKYPDGVNFNSLGARVINVADPKEPQDAVTKHYMESVQDGFVQQNTALVQQATTQATNAKNSASSSATSASQSASSASASETSNQSAKKWAESTASPDNQADTDSTTGKTQSSKSWALQAESIVKNIDFYMMNILQRKKVYSVGDIAFSPFLKSYLYLECTKGGTTSSTTPSLSEKIEGNTFMDGSVTWLVIRDSSRTYVDNTFLPLSGGTLKDTLNISGYHKGITIKEENSYINSGAENVYTDILNHVDANNNRFFFLRSSNKDDKSTSVSLQMVSSKNIPLTGIDLIRSSDDTVSINIYGKEIREFFYPYTNIGPITGGFARYDNLQIFYTWIKAGATYTYPKPFSGTPRVFIQGITEAVLPSNTSSTSYTNSSSSDIYLLAIGKRGWQ